MAGRVQKEKAPARKETEVSETAAVDTKEELKAEMDAVLDEIDSVLEENAEAFVDAYVQKGGE